MCSDYVFSQSPYLESTRSWQGGKLIKMYTTLYDKLSKRAHDSEVSLVSNS